MYMLLLLTCVTHYSLDNYNLPREDKFENVWPLVTGLNEIFIIYVLYKKGLI
jgi:hypothetical protein